MSNYYGRINILTTICLQSLLFASGAAVSTAPQHTVDQPGPTQATDQGSSG